MEAILEEPRETVVDLHKVEPIVGLDLSDDVPRHRPGSRSDFKNSPRARALRQRAGHRTGQKSAAWQNGSRRFESLSKLAEEQKLIAK